MNAYDKIINTLIEKMEQGIIPWAQEWQPAQNFKTRHRYTGINRLSLSPEGTYFLTLKQANELGGRIRKGSKGLPVVFMSSYIPKDQEEDEEKSIRFLKYYTVFKAEDIEGIEFPDFTKETFEPLEKAQAIIDGYKNRPIILHEGSRACYNSDTDRVKMPHKASFKNPEAYYQTLFHELAHSTGSKKRLNRLDYATPRKFDKEGRAKEELVAELTSAFLCHEAGIPFDVENTAAYLQSWLQVFKNDKRMVISAAAQAEKAAAYILGTTAETEAKTLEGVAA